jgi:hypothetical protein
VCICNISLHFRNIARYELIAEVWTKKSFGYAVADLQF